MGSHLDKPVTEKETDNSNLHGQFSFSGSAMQGWRSNMEDSHYGGAFQVGGTDVSLAAVFDGHGGDLVAKEAAIRIQPAIEKALEGCNLSDTGDIGTRMQAAFMALDHDLRHMPAVQSGDDQSGCTAIVALITDTHIIVANAGDARGILQQGDTTKAMSYDHKPYNEIETKRIEAAGGCVSMRRVNGDLAVSRALGDFNYKQCDSQSAKEQAVTAFPDIEVAERNGDDEFLLLCCDGIWDVMSNDEAGLFVRGALGSGYKGMALSEVCSALIMRCLEKGSRDNMSAVVVANHAVAKIGDAEPPLIKGPLFVYDAHRWNDVDVALRADGSLQFSMAGEDVRVPLKGAACETKVRLTEEQQNDSGDGAASCFQVNKLLFRSPAVAGQAEWLSKIQPML